VSKTWSTQAVQYLTDWRICPRCDSAVLPSGVCSSCSADLTTRIAADIKQASTRAAYAIRARQTLVESLTKMAVVAPPVVLPAPIIPSATPVGTPSGSQVSVQSVLAIVGAALFAVAAIVFTFLNPDLTSFDTRTAIVGVITVVFLGGAWLLARAKLQFSAEAVGALGMVFVALDVWAFSTSAWPDVNGWALGALGTLVSALVMIIIASLVRIRTWLWIALVGLAITPAFFGYAVGGVWAATLGHVGVVVVALGIHDVIRRLASRFGSQLNADQATATILQFVFGIIALGQLFFSPSIQQSAAVIAVLAVIAVASTRNRLRRTWSLIGGALFAFAAVILSFSVNFHTPTMWQLVLAPLAAGLVVSALGFLMLVDARRTGTSIRSHYLLFGAWGVAVAAAAPAGLGSIVQLSHDPILRADNALSANLGVVAITLTTLALAAIFRGLAAKGRANPMVARGLLATTSWFALLAVVAFAGWAGLPNVAQVTIGLTLALGLSILVSRVAAVMRLQLMFRIPMVVGAHLLLVVAAAISWSGPTLSLAGGAGAVLVLVAVAQTVPAKLRPAHTATGFGYALIIVAHALALAHVDTIAELSITTAVASACALVVTLVRRLSAGFWYAVLGVTLIPFLIGIVDVLFVRSGWTALSTGVTFALALTLLVTRRSGLSRYLRAFAAAILVPALAVVVICLGAQVILVSASPITLPIIAVIVACTLPSTGLIGASLRRLGLSDADVRLATLWIEISALVTAALAVVLALVRAAAGLNTSFIVLLIIGLGAAVTGLTTKRRYAWAVAGASWTGALWCFWALIGVTVLEPYILPPAIAAAIVGAISVARKLPGLGLYSIGLVCAVVPSLVVLAGWGNGSSTLAWRAYGVMGGALILLVIGGLLSRMPKSMVGHRLGALQVPTLLVAIIAAAAGAAQAVRLGRGFAPSVGAPPMALALEFSAAATILAASAGALMLVGARREIGVGGALILRTRWLFAPAAVYLVVGPIAAARQDWFSIWSLWLLSVAVLLVMIVTVVRGRSGRTWLPPVWFLFALAWFTAVAGWSERQLRVEAFSIPLGVALLVAGILAMRTHAAASRSVNTWPIGFAGSWRLLTPGIVVIFLPSVLATGTDPQTLRAIFVIALALVGILIGSLRKLGAPFILGIIVLPLENITVFAVQASHSIGATPWWITLATAGAVLLVIAVTYERRDSGDRSVAARLRDLR
jgi:hypothetical protein